MGISRLFMYAWDGNWRTVPLFQIAGTIGTSLLLGSDKPLQRAGPLSVLLAYAYVRFLKKRRSLGEHVCKPQGADSKNWGKSCKRRATVCNVPYIKPFSRSLNVLLTYCAQTRFYPQNIVRFRIYSAYCTSSLYDRKKCYFNHGRHHFI